MSFTGHIISTTKRRGGWGHLIYGKGRSIIVFLISTVTSKCIPSPCKNGGTCEENGGSYKCLCLPGFEGSNCEGKLD